MDWRSTHVHQDLSESALLVVNLLVSPGFLIRTLRLRFMVFRSTLLPCGGPLCFPCRKEHLECILRVPQWSSLQPLESRSSWPL